MRDQEPILAVQRHGSMNRTALGLREDVQKRAPLTMGVGRAWVDRGMARQQHTVVAQQLDGGRPAQRNGREISIEIPHLHRAQHQTEKLAVRTGHLADEVDGPGPGRPVAHRRSHERGQLRVGLEHAVEFTIRDIDIRQGPEAGKIEQLALGVDQRDRADMRPTADLVLEHEVDVEARHLPLVIFG